MVDKERYGLNPFCKDCRFAYLPGCLNLDTARSRQRCSCSNLQHQELPQRSGNQIADAYIWPSRHELCRRVSAPFLATPGGENGSPSTPSFLPFQHFSFSPLDSRLLRWTLPSPAHPGRLRLPRPRSKCAARPSQLQHHGCAAGIHGSLNTTSAQEPQSQGCGRANPVEVTLEQPHHFPVRQRFMTLRPAHCLLRLKPRSCRGSRAANGMEQLC